MAQKFVFGEAFARPRCERGFDLTREIADGLLQIRIVTCESQRRAVVHQRLRQFAATMMNIGDAANRREIFRCVVEDVLEFDLRLVQLVEFDQGAAERHARGKIRGMDGEARAANVHGFLELPRAAALFGKLRKCNRRRILVDPASKVFNARIIGHPYVIVTVIVVVPTRP